MEHVCQKEPFGLKENRLLKCKHKTDSDAVSDNNVR